MNDIKNKIFLLFSSLLVSKKRSLSRKLPLIIFLFSFSFLNAQEAVVDSILSVTDTVSTCNTEFIKNLTNDSQANYNYYDSLAKKEKNYIQEELSQTDSISALLHKTYNSSDFDYTEPEKDPEKFSWFSRMMQSIAEFFDSFFSIGSIGTGSQIMYYLLVGLAIALLGYIIYRLVISGRNAHKNRNEEKIANEVDFIEKNLDTVDLTNYLKDALKNEDYRLAVRLLHLENLQLLHQKKLIDWQYKKTNLDFYNELKDEKLRELFQNTSKIYEYIWFGNFDITKESFMEYEKLFTELKNARIG